jgi:hypothetical protein
MYTFQESLNPGTDGYVVKAKGLPDKFHNIRNIIGIDFMYLNFRGRCSLLYFVLAGGCEHDW